MHIERYILQLKERLNIEFGKHDRSGVYGFTQRSMAYNSNKIEGRLLLFLKRELCMQMIKTRYLRRRI